MGYTHYLKLLRLPTPAALQYVLTVEIPKILDCTKDIKIQKGY